MATNRRTPITPLAGILAAIVLMLAPARLVFAQAPIPGYPERIDAYDSREVALLPAFCRFTQVFRQNVPNDPVERERWIAYLGNTNYLPLHHYCWGLMKTNRAMLLARSSESRNFYLADAITEYDYVIARVLPDFVLLPEILTKKAENLILLGRGPQGVAELTRAIDAKPDYWPAYAKLADYYKDTNDLTRAREVLDEGLKNAPNAPALQRRLEDLGRAKNK